MTREELFEQLSKGEISLSYSALREFAESPAHFVRYKTKEKKTTDAMRFGSLVHCAVLEPDELDSRYLVFDRSAMPFPESTLNKKENKAYKLALEAQAASESKELVDSSDWNKAMKLRDLVHENIPASKALNKCFEYEQGFTYDLDGYKFRGYVDGVGFNHIVDLKKVTDASPDKIRYKAIREKWHWQAYLYAKSINPSNPFIVDVYYVCVCDSDMGISVNKIEWSLLNQAQAEIENVVDSFKKCIDTGDWESNYDYWSDNGIFSID